MLKLVDIRFRSMPQHPILSLSLARSLSRLLAPLEDATLLDSGLLEQAGGVAQFACPVFEFASPGFLANRISDTRTCQV